MIHHAQRYMIEIEKKTKPVNTWQSIIVFWMGLNDKKHIFHAIAIYHAQWIRSRLADENVAFHQNWMHYPFTATFEWESNFHGNNRIE